MAYDPYERASTILNLKGQWETADEENKKRIANQAKQHYKSLIDNGYEEIANQLQNSNYQQAKDAVKRVQKKGMTAGRNYMVDQLTGKYGMSKDQANAAITWDPYSGDVFLGGINVGRGDVLVDGTNYYKDTTVLDKALNQYAKNSGLSAPTQLAYNQGVQSVNDRLSQDWGIQLDNQNNSDNNYANYQKIAQQDPTETSYWKNIMDSFESLGDQAGYNQIASGAGSNGGNVDSYSQANAARQMAAFRSQGVQAANEGYNNWLNGILSGIQSQNADNSNMQTSRMNNVQTQINANQQVFDNNETARLNDSAIETNHANNLATQAEVTGYVPGEWLYSNNPYFNADGTLKDEYKDFDFKAAINQAVARGDEDQANLLRVARGAKIASDREAYGQYDDGDWIAPTPQQTEAARQFNANDATTRYGIDKDAETERYVSDNATDAAMYQADSAERTQAGINKSNENISASSNAAAIEQAQIAAKSNENIANTQLAATLTANTAEAQDEQTKALIAKFDTSADNINTAYKAEGYSKGEGVPVIMKGTDGSYYFNPTIDRSAYLDPVIAAVLRDSSLNATEKNAFLTELGISPEDTARVKGYLGL